MNEKFHSTRRDGDRKEQKESRDSRESRDSKFARNSRDTRDSRDARKPREGRGSRGDSPFKSRDDRPERGDRFERSERPSRGDRFERSEHSSRGDRPFRPRADRAENGEQQEKREFRPRRQREGFQPKGEGRPFRPRDERKKPAVPQKRNTRPGVRLNKYIANAGICSRREADQLIEAGSVMVNGEVVTQMGYMVQEGDVVNYGGETLRSEAKRYFLLNKPKGFITTVDDPQSRETVMMLIDGACPERIYPVGRLDRNTTGLLLFTNDGDLARKLTHPSTGVYKIYHVELNKPVTRDDMKQMMDGIELEDGPIKVDDVQYVEEAHDKRVVGVALHSGKNRIVRRIFEHLGYDVHKLDRVVFAGLTKKDLPRGRFRELTEKEVGFLKMI